MSFVVRISMIFSYFLSSESKVLENDLNTLLLKKIILLNLLSSSSMISEIKSPKKRSLRKVSVFFHYYY